MKFFSESWVVEKSRFLKKTVLPSSTSLLRSTPELSPFQDLFVLSSSPPSPSSSSPSPSSSSSSSSSSSPSSSSLSSSSSSLSLPLASTSSVLELVSVLFSEFAVDGVSSVVSFGVVSSVTVWAAYWVLGMAQSTAIGLPTVENFYECWFWWVKHNVKLYSTQKRFCVALLDASYSAWNCFVLNKCTSYKSAISFFQQFDIFNFSVT